MTEQRHGLTEGLVIAGVPAAGYWFAYLFELGYCKYFDIPPSFIEIGVLNVLVATIGLCGMLSLISFYTTPLYMLSKGLPQPIRIALFRISVPFVLVGGYALVARLTLTQFAIANAIFLVPLLCLEFVLPIFTQKNVVGYLRKLEAQDQVELAHETIVDVVAKVVGPKTFLFVAFLFLLSLLAYFAGGYEAKMQRSFMVLAGTSEKIVLKRKDGYFVAAQFDRASKAVSAKFALVPSDQPLLEFGYERIGPLVPVEVK